MMMRAGSLRISHFLVSAFVLMLVAMGFVWCHVGITRVNYQIAEELEKRDRLLEDERRLKVEIATLKSPQRIEAIARHELGMNYPGKAQVVFLR